MDPHAPLGQRLLQQSQSIAQRLRDRPLRVVLAESCTGGLVSACLASVPGISESLCGSAVTYRNATKRAWLGVRGDWLEDPGPVSRGVAEAMARGVLERTGEADLAVSITGHLGPDAPADQDGLVFVGIARRTAAGQCETVDVHAHRLATSGRDDRRHEAAALVLEHLQRALETRP